jgi:ornithine--oxo-acid transaminase
MTFELSSLIEARQGENFRLHSEYLNPQLVKVLKTLGFDRFYVRGEGSYLYDRNGDRYLDFLAGFGVFALGRGHPVVKKALHEALDMDLPNLVQLDAALLPGLLAEALVARTHEGIQRCFFSNSGAEAIEAAIKFARYATKRPRIIYADHAFHGLSLGALSLNGGKEFREGFGALLPGCYEVPFGDIGALERELQRDDVAALVLEIIQGKGVNLASDEYWAAVAELCRKHGTLLVIDEVQTGLGRTGKLWAHEHYGLRPDIITVSKALSGGYVPVGAMMCSAEVFDRVYSKMERAVVHSSTFGRNQLAMVAALATLQTIDDEDIVDRREVRALSRGARQGSDHRPRLRGANLFRVEVALEDDGGRTQGALLPACGGTPVPPTQDLDPGRRRQHERRQAAPPADRRPGGGGLLRGRARRRARGRPPQFRPSVRIRQNSGQERAP